ncbi:M50 family metallopeptidase [archaeon]|nr:M50 family metallopeptidase [archaeon]
MIFTFQELIDVVVMTLAVGFIFMDVFRQTKYYYGLNWQDLKFSCMVTAPAIILHELMHKLAAVSFGLNATFHAAYEWLFLGIFLKLLGGFVFFVPGYVSMSGLIHPYQNLIISFAGPGTNLILYLASAGILKYKKISNKKHYSILVLTRYINGFLFILNMIPLPFFDGGHVFQSLIQIFF